MNRWNSRGVYPRGAVRRACCAALGAGLMVAAGAAAAAQTYIVLYQQYAVPGTALRAVSVAGGTLVATYSSIGVAIARSDNPAFAANLKTSKGVQNVVATAAHAVKLDGAVDTAETDATALQPPTPAPGSRAGMKAQPTSVSREVIGLAPWSGLTTDRQK